MRALIDMAVSLIREDQYKSLGLQGQLKRPDITISEVDRKKIMITGMVWKDRSVELCGD